jgi:uncharacterized SAM-binding protein YcdF (DUF218 family)
MRRVRITTLRLGALFAFLWLLVVSWRIIDVARLRPLPARADVALVLGAGAPGGRPSPVFAGRIDYAVELFHTGIVHSLLFTGGTGAGENIPDAEAAKTYAISKGVPADRIRVETTSRTTRENLAEAHRLLRQDSPESTCLLISDPLHLFRASRMMRDEGLAGIPAPAPTTRIRSLRHKSRFFIHELWFYHVYLLTGK